MTAMLSKLFKTLPKWQSPKSQKRLEAVAEFNPGHEKDAFLLTQLARSDSEPAVRRAAVARLHDLDAITQIQKRDLDAGVREAATDRLQALLAGKDPHAPDVATRLALVARIGTPQPLLYLIREAEPLAVRLAAVAQVQDELCLQDVALNGSVAAVRQAAAERIQSVALLEELATATRQKDKSVYRIVRGRLDALQAAARQQATLRQKAEALCESMESHARAALNPLYAARTESLRQHWLELAADTIAPALTERFVTACQMADRQVQEVAQAAQQAAEKAQAAEELQAAVSTLDATLASYQGQADFDLPAFAAVRKTQQLRWELAAALQTPSPTLAARYDTLMSALDALAAHLAQWQDDADAVQTLLAAEALDDAACAEIQALLAAYAGKSLPLPAPLAELATRANLASTTTTPAAHVPVSAPPEALIRLQGWLDELATHLDSGASREASRLWRRIQDSVRQHALHDARLPALAERMRELKSWAGFAVLPKKEALLASMQQLADDSAMDPDDKADRIQQLQAEWKALGVVDASREQVLWEQFKAASDRAYEPCRAHFAAQHAQRQENLAKRRHECEQLESWRDRLAALDDAAVDWKTHDAILKTAREEWQRYHPVERREGAKLQERFNAVLAELHERRRAHQEAVATAKRALLQKAEALATATDLRAACDAARALQAEWKTLGQAHPKDERQLWQGFRAACDAVFARREQDYKARQQARDDLQQQAEELLLALEALAADGDPARAGEAARLEESFRALLLPRESAGPLKARLQKALTRYADASRAQQQATASAARETVLNAWLAMPAGDAGDEVLAALPAALRHALQQRPQTGDTADAGARFLAGVLDLELALELPSPPAQEEARRARQMQWLTEKGLRSKAQDTRSTLLAVLGIGPLDAATAQDAVPRLRAILEKTAI